MKRLSLLLVLALPPVTMATNELSIARSALRDGLWEIARNHAAKVEGDEARLVTLESFAREGRWEALLAALDGWAPVDAPEFAYYRALAELRLGRVEDAWAHLPAARFASDEFTGAAARLRAELCLAKSMPAAALDSLNGLESDDPEAMMIAAAAQLSKGARAEAERLWRQVAVATNASDEAVLAAGVRLEDVEVLRYVMEHAKTAGVRRRSSLHLGMRLLEDPDGFAEGAKLIRSAVIDEPSSELARTAFYRLIDALIVAGDCKAAAAALNDALEMWPDAVRSPYVQESRGIVSAGQGRTDEALEAFRLSEELATNDEAKAMSRVRYGETLAAAGRREEAMTAFREAIRRYPTASAAKRVSETVAVMELEAAGREDFQRYRFDEARRNFNEVAGRDPARRRRMEYYEVMCLYGLGYDDAAETKARSLITCDDPAVAADVRLWLAKFAYNRRRWSDALELFVGFVEVAPTDPEAGGALVWAARSAFAANEYARAVQLATRLVNEYPASESVVTAMIIEGESLIELARFDESVLVLEQAAMKATKSAERLRARLLGADALFAMGADNSARYQAALDAYTMIGKGETLSPSERLTLAYKIARTLERLKRTEEAADQYYSQVVLAYREGREAGTVYGEDAQAAFSRAAFRLAENFESRGLDRQAVQVLRLLSTSDVPASAEAAKSIERIERKGNIL